MVTNEYDLIKNFVKTIDSEVKVQFYGDEWYAIINEGIINVSFRPDEYADQLMNNFIYEKFGVEVDSFLIGILHEIGHIETYVDGMDEERSLIYAMLQLDYSDEMAEDFHYMYFSIPSEFEATKWGVEYYLSHKEKCDEFLSQLQSLFN